MIILVIQLLLGDERAIDETQCVGTPIPDGILHARKANGQ
jgi:hypothetical protein